MFGNLEIISYLISCDIIIINDNGDYDNIQIITDLNGNKPSDYRTTALISDEEKDEIQTILRVYESLCISQQQIRLK
jgi:hypothetical protein